MDDEGGFTLIEVLVALVIMAVATVGLIGATEAYIDSVRGVGSRIIAQWVAENKIVELTVSGNRSPSNYELVEMLDRTWKVQVTPKPSSDADLAAYVMSVSELNASQPSVIMDFFVESGKIGK